MRVEVSAVLAIATEIVVEIAMGRSSNIIYNIAKHPSAHNSARIASFCAQHDSSVHV